MSEYALGIIDAQASFMPAIEGVRLRRSGFGELPVADGDHIIRPANRLIGAFAAAGQLLFTTQDWYPASTAHFSDQPDFTSTWPPHCIADTSGAELHPDLELPADTASFLKGTAALKRSQEDTSYSAYYALCTTNGIYLPEWLDRHRVRSVVLGGLAFDYCVGKTALDLRQKLGVEVTIATSATRSISAASEAEMHATLKTAGIRTVRTEALLQELGFTPPTLEELFETTRVSH